MLENVMINVDGSVYTFEDLINIDDNVKINCLVIAATRGYDSIKGENVFDFLRVEDIPRIFAGREVTVHTT